MFFLRQPGRAQLEPILQSNLETPLNYRASNCSHPDEGYEPASFVKDHYRTHLGEGKHIYERACQALQHWKMYSSDWLSLYPSRPQVKAGEVLLVIARHLGFYSVNPLRIVYLEASERRFAFAVGALPDHSEQGEERFLLEQLANDHVYFDLLVYSRPNHPLLRLGYPYARVMQRRFAKAAAMNIVKAL